MITVYSMRSGYCQMCDALSHLLDSYNIEYKKLILGEDFTSNQFISKFGRTKGFPYIVDENGNDLGDVREVLSKFLKDNQ